MNASEIAKEARSIKKDHGFDIVSKEDWDVQEGVYLIGTKLSGMHAEITEMFQNDSEENFIEEACDTIIQTLELIHPFVDEYPDDLFNGKFMLWGGDRDFAMAHGYVSGMYEYLRKDELKKFVSAAFNLVRWVSRMVEVGCKGRWNIEEEIKKKMDYNHNRPKKHGGKRC